MVEFPGYSPFPSRSGERESCLDPFVPDTTSFQSNVHFLHFSFLEQSILTKMSSPPRLHDLLRGSYRDGQRIECNRVEPTNVPAGAYIRSWSFWVRCWVDNQFQPDLDLRSSIAPG
jgi:hypothetical protein